MSNIKTPNPQDVIQPKTSRTTIDGSIVDTKTSTIDPSLSTTDDLTTGAFDRAKLIALATQKATSTDSYEENDVSSSGGSISKDVTWKTWEGHEISYNKKMTLRNIGLFMSEKMKDSVTKYKANEEELGATPPRLGFPISGKDDIYNSNNFYKMDQEAEMVDKPDGMINSSSADGGFGIYNLNIETLKSIPRDYKGIGMGESKILNPDFQFNELDDLRSDFRNPAIGRLYGERIYNFNLPKVLFQVGTVSINMKLLCGLGSLFFNNNSGKTLANYLRDPETNFIKRGFQHLTSAISTVASFAAGGILRKKKMYKFTSTNKVYLQYVNEIILEIAAWMGLGRFKIKDEGIETMLGVMKEDFSTDSIDDPEENTGSKNQTDEASKQNIFEKFFGAKVDGSNPNSDITSTDYQDVDNVTYTRDLPNADGYFGRGVLNVFNILPCYSKYRGDADSIGGNKVTKAGETAKGTPNNIKDKGLFSFYNADLYIPYTLQKGVNVSETFTNSTQEHPIVSTLNGQGLTNQQQAMIGQLPLNVEDAISEPGKVKDKIKDQLMQNALSKAKDFLAGMKSGETGMIQTGNARLTLPEIWSDSTFDRSYSLTFKFRSPYGHRLSIFENTIVPLVFLIAMASPRQVGSSSYTNPFYVKAFSKGLFVTELGMVSSLTINRGEDRNDRTQEGFARNVTVTMSIKDVVPKLTMSLDAGIFGILSAQNEGFRNYISFIANVDILDSQIVANRMKMFGATLRSRFNKDTFVNNLRFGLSQSFVSQLITNPRSIFYKSSSNDSLKSKTVPTSGSIT